MTHGATDAVGLRAEKNKVHVHDLHATILHLLGFDHEQLTFFHDGRDQRLTDVAGKVVQGVYGMMLIIRRFGQLGLLTCCWLIAGAAEEPERVVTDEDRAHWAYQPLAVSPVGSGLASRNPVDAFIEAELDRRGLGIAAPAGKAALLRRLTFDLTGLPPSRRELLDFLSDRSPEAYERVVDRLLASPRYGERWAQHWLDIARFAESDGFEFDHERKEAWRYRDWVIESLNADIAVERFVRAQLAGDEASPPDPAGTGFLVAGPDMVDINLPEERRHNFLNEMTSTTGAVFLGLSFGCAQCHDHKTDAISIQDFYRLRSFFDNTVVAPVRSRQMPATVAESGSPPPSFVMLRGDFRRKGAPVTPAFPAVLSGNESPALDPDASARAGSSMRRTALVDWMLSGESGLVFRVMANRLWQFHFGKGIVASSNDFGKGGAEPTHPQLLDWLASRLREPGAGFKSLHRLIVSSRTYRQSSYGDSVSTSVKEDPDNLWYARMPRRRLTGEAIRDAMLFTSGKLNTRMLGPGVRPPLPPEITSTLLKNQWNVTTGKDQHVRRSVYLFVRRNLRFPMFDVFDRPDANASCAVRNISTTAPQSLMLINSDFSFDCSRALARRASNEAGTDRDSAITFIFETILARRPSPAELEEAANFVLSRSGEESIQADSGFRALAELCLAIYNTNEAVYLD